MIKILVFNYYMCLLKFIKIFEFFILNNCQYDNIAIVSSIYNIIIKILSRFCFFNNL